MVTFGLIMGGAFVLLWFFVARPIVGAVERRLEQESRDR